MFEAIGNAALHSSGKEDEFALLAGSGSIQKAVQEALAKQAENRQKALGEALVRIMDQVAERKQRSVQLIRELRRSEQQNLQQLKDIDRAMAYGAETGNFVPLCEQIGFHSTCLGVNASQFEELSKIPKDWSPKES